MKIRAGCFFYGLANRRGDTCGMIIADKGFVMDIFETDLRAGCQGMLSRNGQKYFFGIQKVTVDERIFFGLIKFAAKS